MITMPAAEPHPYPTEHLAGLLPSICSELGVLRRIVAASPSASATSTDPCNHTALLDLAESLVDAARPAFELFFSYPTQRLSGSLILQAAEMTQAIAWLAQQPPPEPHIPLLAEYPACCERIQGAIRDFRLAVELEAAVRDLDRQAPETLN